MEAIRTYFEQLVKMKDQDWEFFSSRLVQQNFPKKTVLLKAGQTEKYLSFIMEGIVRFYIMKKEEECTISFSFPHDFVSAYDSFLTQSPCHYYVETISEVVLCRISYEDLQQVYANTEIGNTIGRLASERLYLEAFKREISFLTETAEQRYLHLFTEQPHIIQQIPLKFIASYIGITPQALSRIRRQIS